MLTGEPLGRAIEQAIEKKKVSKADVARHFGVKPPSVQDWIRYGRINKKHLDKLFAYFADVVGPEHWGIESAQAAPVQNETSVREPEPRYEITPELSPAELEVIEQIRLIPEELQPAALASIQSVLKVFVTANKAATHAGAGPGKEITEGGGERKSGQKT